MNQEMSQETPNKKPPYRSFSRKERLIPSILLSIALPFTFFFFSSFEAYCAGLEQLHFNLGEFIWISLLLSLLCAGGLFALLWNLKGRVFDVVYGVLFAVALMLFVQGTYLNFDMNALPGDGVGVSSFTTFQTVLDTLLWVLVIGGAVTAVLLIKKWREILRLVMTVGMIAVIGVQLMNFTVLALTTEVMVPVVERGEQSGEPNSPEGDQVLTTAGLTELSAEGNVILFIVDRYDYDFYRNILKVEPNFFEGFDGFTSYTNNISQYARTYPSVTYMLTGVENDFDTSRAAYFEKAYSDNPFFKTLKSSGYDIKLYTSDYYGYDDATVFSEYVDNISSAKGYEVLDRSSLWGDMMRMALFRYLPVVSKSWVGSIGSDDANTHVSYDSEMPMYATDMKAVYDAMTKEPFTLQRDAKTFACIHVDGCHSPFKYDEEWNLLSEDDPRKNDYSKAEIGMRTSFTIIRHYIEEMKRLGVYEDATIIITGDHAASYSDTKDLSGSRLTSLMVKKKGEYGTPMKESAAPVSQENLHATIFASEGITADYDVGRSIFDIKEDDTGKRYYYFQKSVSGDADEIVVYEVVGDANNFENWTIVERIPVSGDLT